MRLQTSGDRCSVKLVDPALYSCSSIWISCRNPRQRHLRLPQEENSLRRRERRSELERCSPDRREIKSGNRRPQSGLVLGIWLHPVAATLPSKWRREVHTQDLFNVDQISAPQCLELLGCTQSHIYSHPHRPKGPFTDHHRCTRKEFFLPR